MLCTNTGTIAGAFLHYREKRESSHNRRQVRHNSRFYLSNRPHGSDKISCSRAVNSNRTYWIVFSVPIHLAFHNLSLLDRSSDRSLIVRIFRRAIPRIPASGTVLRIYKTADVVIMKEKRQNTTCLVKRNDHSYFNNFNVKSRVKSPQLAACQSLSTRILLPRAILIVKSARHSARISYFQSREQISRSRCGPPD